MINFLPPAGLPTPPEPGGARNRREPGPDFAQWLQAAPEEQSAAAKVVASATQCEESPAVPVEPTPARPWRIDRDPRLPLVQAEPPHPPALLANLPQNPQELPAYFDQQHFEQLAQHFQELAQQWHASTPVVHPNLPESVGAHGHAEMADPVLLPWRLQANAGLSYLGTPAWLAGAGQVVPAAGEAPSAPLAGGATVADAAAGAPARQAAAPRRGSLAWLAHLSDNGAGGVDREQRTERLGQWLAGHPGWKERLLRWTGDEADLTAWIRDFQLGEDDLGALVAKLREYAQEHGHPLARVMHNGREVWRAGNDQLHNGSES